MLNRNVRIRLEIDPSCPEPEVIIRAGEQSALTDKIVSAVERCLENASQPIAAFQKDTLVLVSQDDIFRVYTENRKLVICTETERYESRPPLKELFEKLDRERFIRISRFEIVNLRKTSGFDFSRAGTIRVLFQDGSETWVARRYIQAIQQMLKHSEAGEEAKGHG